MIINTNYVRKSKEKDLLKKSDSITKRFELNVETHKDAIILPLLESNDNNTIWGMGGVINSYSNEYYELSSTYGHIYGGYQPNCINVVHKKVVYLGYLFPLYGEFIVQSITRLWYFLKYDSKDIDYYVFTFRCNEKRTINGNFKRIFELVGIWNKLYFISVPTQFDEVIIPEDSYQIQNYYSDEYNLIVDTIIKNALKNSDVKKYQKVFLTRSCYYSTNNSDIGLEILDDFHKRNGYHIISPENVKIDDLITIMYYAQEISSFSGTCAHNLLFTSGQNKTTVFERYPNNNPMQIDICAMRDLNISFIDANLPIYLVEYSNGVCILSYTECFRKYVEDNKLSPPSEKYYNKKSLKKSLQKYFAVYRNKYNYSMRLSYWIQSDIRMHGDGYSESYNVYKDYLDRKRPIWWWQIFLDKKIIKNYAKRFLIKLNLYKEYK